MKKTYRRRSLKYKIFFLLIVMAVVFDITMTAVSYFVYTRNMNEESSKMCYAISNAVASDLNGMQLISFSEKQNSEEYKNREEGLINLVQSYTNLSRLTVFKAEKDEMEIIFNIDDQLKNNDYGKKEAYNSLISNKASELEKGKFYGSVFAENAVMSFSPVESKAGNVYYVMSEISMAQLIEDRQAFVKTLFITVGIVALLLMLFANFYMNHTLISPLNKIESKLRNFSETNCSGDETVEGIKKIKCRNVAEIETICNCFIELINDVSIKENEVREFDKNVTDRMKTIIEENN